MLAKELRRARFTDPGPLDLPHTWADLPDLAQAFLRVARGTLPWPLLRALGLVVPTFAALAELRYLWQRPHQLVGNRMQVLVGTAPHTPFQQAVRAALAELELTPAPVRPAVPAGA